MVNPLEATDPMEGGRRCTAHARSTGDRCGNRPIPGGTVCRFHGGAAPAVRLKAKLRLAELVDPAIATLARIMVKAEHDRDKLRAVENILDRGGLPRASRVEGRMQLEESKALLMQRILELRAAPPALAAPSTEVLDAEVVEDDEDR